MFRESLLVCMVVKGLGPVWVHHSTLSHPWQPGRQRMPSHGMSAVLAQSRWINVGRPCGTWMYYAMRDVKDVGIVAGAKMF